MTDQWHEGNCLKDRSVSTETYDANWERIFGKNDQKKSEQEIIDEVSKDIAEETLQATEPKEEDNE
jgi:hypothetical protein